MTPDVLRGLQILVVDDEEANVELLQDLLEIEGYTAVTGFTDPRAAMEHVAGQLPDLILLDLLMPGIDGYDFLARVRPLAAGGEFLPIVILTADITPQSRLRALDGGATDFLTKPFDHVELMLRVRNLLQTRLYYLTQQRQLRWLEQMHQEVQQRLDQRDATHSVISHDMGQPLASIRLAAEMLRVMLTSPGRLDRGRALARLELIERSSQQLDSMAGEMVDLARLQSGPGLDLVHRPADLVALVESEVALCAGSSSRHTVTFTPCRPDLHSEVDAPRLRRVLMNLLSNAVKYSPHGGEIAVRLDCLDDHGRPWVEIAVRDQGIGIPQADLPRLFEPFHRAANVTGRIRGSGLGLWGAKKIVDAHGGDLRIESTEGAGSTITVRLPLD